MNDRAVSLLEQYEIEVISTGKGRGAILCNTKDGCLIFKEYQGREDRLTLQKNLLDELKESGNIRSETLLPTKEGALFVKDNEGTRYILKTYEEGRECNLHDRGECVEAAKVLAKLHLELKKFKDIPVNLGSVSREKEYEKRNRELRRIRKYLQQRSQKTWFEIYLMQQYDPFLDQALKVEREWKEYIRDREEEKPFLCHGDYQYHNILWNNNEWFIINFEKYSLDSPVRDLYLLLRKLLEKSNWSVSLGTELIESYDKINTLSRQNRMDLYYRLAYPEKFRKIVNFYYNSGKAWIPGKNQEKLEKLIAQEEERNNFLREVFLS